MRHYPGDVGLTARTMTQECTQIAENDLSVPFWGICVHCCVVGLGCGWPWDRNSVHRSPKMASRYHFRVFVYTVATRVAIRIATRAASGGTSASAAMACRRLLLAGPSRLVGKTGSERVAPLLGWHLRRGVNPHEPPMSPDSWRSRPNSHCHSALSVPIALPLDPKRTASVRSMPFGSVDGTATRPWTYRFGTLDVEWQCKGVQPVRSMPFGSVDGTATRA